MTLKKKKLTEEEIILYHNWHSYISLNSKKKKYIFKYWFLCIYIRIVKNNRYCYLAYYVLQNRYDQNYMNKYEKIVLKKHINKINTVKFDWKNDMSYDTNFILYTLASAVVTTCLTLERDCKTRRGITNKP